MQACIISQNEQVEKVLLPVNLATFASFNRISPSIYYNFKDHYINICSSIKKTSYKFGSSK